MADYTLAAKGTFDGSGFKKGIGESSKSLDAFKEKCSSIGSKMKSVMGGAAGAIAKVGGVITALATGAFVKGGIDRALNIEDARNKLTQLRMDVNSVMASANQAVDGTKFSLAAAATSASMLGASGVEAGETMTRSLKGAAGVAAMGGREMEEVSRVFSKVAAQGKVQGDELMQLSEMGVNATGALAKHLGVTQAEVTKMVRNGQIDFQTFSDAMYETFGEAAYGANNTFRGVLSNTGAALSRLSAKFADPALQGLKKVFQSAIPAINAVSAMLDPMVARFAAFADALSTRVAGAINGFTEALTNTKSPVSAVKAMLGELFDGTPVGAFISSINGFFKAVQMGVSPIALLKNHWSEFVSAVGNSSALDRVRAMIDGLPEPIRNLASWLSTGGAQAVAFGALFAGVLAKFGGPISTAVEAVVAFGTKFGGVIGALVAEVGRFGFAFLNPIVMIKTAIPAVGSAIAGLVTPVGVAVAAISAIIAAFAYLMTTNEEFRSSVMGLLAQIGASLAPIIAIVLSSITQIAAALAPLMDVIVSQLVPALGQIILVILQLVAGLAPIVTLLMATLMPVITQIITVVAELAAQLVTLLFPIITQIAELIQAVMPVILSSVTAAMTAIAAVVNTVWPLVQAIIETAMSVIQSVISIVTAAINGDWEGVWNGIKSLFESVWNGIGNILSTAIGIVQSVISSALGVIKGIWDSAWSSIASLLDGAWNGMKSAVQSGIDAVIGFVRGIPDGIRNALGNVGSILRNAGEQIIDGFFSGIRAAVGGVYDFVSGIADHIASIKGPKQYDLKVLIPNGQWLMESLNRGIASGIPALDRTLAGITNHIGEWVPDADISFGSPDIIGGVRNNEFSYSGDGITREDLKSVLLEVVPRAISENTPVMGEREFNRAVRNARV